MKPVSFNPTNIVFNVVVYLDFGSFRCISKNSIGQAEAVIELYGISQIFTLFYSKTCYKNTISCENPVFSDSPSPPQLPANIGDKKAHIYLFTFNSIFGQRNVNPKNVFH
jgi:hypothetical protein